jgi:hypothetical protein
MAGIPDVFTVVGTEQGGGSMIETRWQTTIKEQRKKRKLILSAIFWFVIFALMMGLAGEEDRKTVAPVPEQLNPKVNKIAGILANAGSRHPAQLAKAIADTKRPRLVTAVILQESGGNITAVGLAGEFGCGQVMEEHWGAVPADPAGQVKQVEQILEELLSSSQGKIRLALNKYNGDHSGRYADQVIQRIAMVKL